MTAMDIIKLTADEFKEYPEDVLCKWICLYKPWVSKKQFGDFYEQALAFLVCHKMKMAGLGENTLGDLGKIGNAFAASSVSDGGSSISFATGGVGNIQSDAEYAMTVYGEQFLQLRKMVIVPIHVSGEGDCHGWI